MRLVFTIASGVGECRLVLEAGEYIENAPFARRSVADTIGGHQRQFPGTSQRHCGLVPLLFFRIEVALQLNENVVVTVDRK